MMIPELSRHFMFPQLVTRLPKETGLITAERDEEITAYEFDSDAGIMTQGSMNNSSEFLDGFGKTVSVDVEYCAGELEAMTEKEAEEIIAKAAKAIIEKINADGYEIASSLTKKVADATYANIAEAEKMLTEADAPVKDRHIMLSAGDAKALAVETKTENDKVCGFEKHADDEVATSFVFHKNALGIASREPCEFPGADCCVFNVNGLYIRVTAVTDTIFKRVMLSIDSMYKYYVLDTDLAVALGTST